MRTPATTAYSVPQANLGYDPLPVQQLLADQAESIDRIQLAFGLDTASFTTEVLPSIRAYAAFVHLLPATAANYFSQPGGLFALGLEVGFFALQGTDGHIFSGQAPISTRRMLEPRWRHATFLGGLCCELHRAVASLVVTSGGGLQWPAYRMPLMAWIEANLVGRYYLRWRPPATEARGLALFALPHIVAPQVLQDLDDGNAVIVPHLLASIGGTPIYREHNVLDSLVRRALALVIDRDLGANVGRGGSPQFGSHLERYFVDALRRLAATDQAWQPNRERSRVWHAQDGVFIAWPQAASDMLALLDEDLLPGIPRSPETILGLLVAAGIAVVQDSSHPLWRVAPPNGKAGVEAVKLASPALLWPGGASGSAPLPRSIVAAVSAQPDRTAATPPVLTARAGDQLSLIDLADSPPGTPTVGPVAATPATSTPTTADAPRSALKVPMRLSPAIRDGLAAIIDTLNGEPRLASACTVANGIFVPLAELERRGLQPALVLRALADLRLLVPASTGGVPTLTRDFGGSSQAGFVLDPRCVSGLDLRAFLVPHAEPS